jgi:hypothetical protein
MGRASTLRRAAAGGVAAAFAAAGFTVATVAGGGGATSVGQADPVCAAGLDFSYWTDDGLLTSPIHSAVEPIAEPLLWNAGVGAYLDPHNLSCNLQAGLNGLGCTYPALAILKGSHVHASQCPNG